MKRWSKMTYDRDAERWTIHLRNGVHGIHCGEWFELRLGDTAIPCRMEMDHDWYVIMKGTRLILRKKDTYEVEI